MRVAAWNIRLERVRNRHNDLVRSIRLIDADILLLIEFTKDEDLPGLLGALRKEGLPYDARLLTRRAKQNLVYLVRPGIKEIRQQAWTDVMLDNPDHRPALVGQFRAGEFDFTVVGVHLKSKRAGAQDPNEIRREQLLRLVPQMKRALRVDLDLLLVGDYNMIREEDPEQFRMLQNVGLEMLHFWIPATTDSYLARNGRGSLLDGYAISTDARQELRPQSFNVFPLHQRMGKSADQFRDQISDHLPLVAEFDTSVDNDP